MKTILSFFTFILTVFSVICGIPFNSEYQQLITPIEVYSSIFEKEKNQSNIYSGTVSEDKWNPSDELKLTDTVVLKKEKGKDFVILNLSDIHFGDYGTKAYNSLNTTAKITTMVKSVKPDLITVSGDFVCSDHTYFSIRRLTDLMESFGITWAPIFGNHDGEGNCDLNYLADTMLNSPNCVFRKGDKDIGIGNYIISIVEESADSTRIVEALIMIQSRADDYEKQNQWVQWATDGINRISDSKAEISLFTHIPLPEYQYAYEQAYDTENNCWKDEYKVYGEIGEEIACDRKDGIPVQRGLFDILRNSGTVKYVFCSHDHLNNLSIMYEGIRLSYTTKIGQSSGNSFMLDGGTEIIIGAKGITNIRQKSLALGSVITLEDISI